MQPPQNGAVPQGIRQTTPQQQHQLPTQGGLRATPPRPGTLASPTGGHFPNGSPSVNLQTVLQMIQLAHPHLPLAEATKLAIENLPRIQQQESLRNANANGVLQQHLQQQMAKSSPTQAPQQVRRSPSQN